MARPHKSRVAGDAPSSAGPETVDAQLLSSATTRTPPAVRDPSGPKTTRPDTAERREVEPKRSTGQKLARTFDAAPDRVDIRDWFYQPRLGYLPDQVVNCDLVPAILDQGSEGACTGYALAGVINYLLAGRDISRRVSARMLYEMARRYDLGMLKFISDRAEDEATIADADIAAMMAGSVDGRPALVVAGDKQGDDSFSRSETPGGFDNDLPTMNAVLRRILGGAPKRPFTIRDLQY